MEIRLMQPEEAAAVSDLVIETLRTTNAKDYSLEYLEGIVQRKQPADILAEAEHFHFYVAVEDRRIVGCGAIGPYWGSPTESSLFTLFVHPAHQGKGIGRQLIQALEQDAYGLRAQRIEVPASITATPFYLKCGYQYKPGHTEPDEEGLLRLEKFPAQSDTFPGPRGER